jgi:hypothetical protein
LLEPLRRLRGMGSSLRGPGVKHALLWGLGAVVALGFLTGKGVRSGSMTRLLRLGTSLLPLVRLFLSSGRRP